MRLFLSLFTKKWFLCTVLLIVIALCLNECGRLAHENKRLSDNQAALLEGVEYYRTKSDLSAASVAQLTLTNSELKQHYNDVVKEAEDLNLEVKRLESASRTASETVYKTVTEWKDSIIYVEGKPDTIRCIEYSDTWLSFAACEIGGVMETNIKSRDTLVQFVHRVPRRFLFFKFGTKAIRQEVMLKNPNSTITYTEYIKLKRKKGQ